MNDCITTTKQSTTKPCAYFLGYTVSIIQFPQCQGKALVNMRKSIIRFLHRCYNRHNKTKYSKAMCILFEIHCTVYPKKYAHGFVVLCFVVVMQSFIMNSHEVFIHIHQGCFAGTGAIVRLPQCQWSKPDGYGKISRCITTTKHSKAKTVCIFLGIYCTYQVGYGFMIHH